MKIEDKTLYEHVKVKLFRGVDYQPQDTYRTINLVDVQPSVLDELAVAAGYERCTFSSLEHVTEEGTFVYATFERRVRADEQHSAR